MIRVIRSRRLRWDGHVAQIRERKDAHKVLVSRSKGKRPLGRTRRRWEDNIKMDLLTAILGGKDLIDLVQSMYRWWSVVNAENEPLCCIKCWEFLY